MDIYKRLAIAIKQSRNAIGLSQEEFAEKLDVSSTHIKHLESGHRKPSVEILFSISRLTGMSIDRLLFSEDEKESAYTEQLNAIIDMCLEDEKKLLSEIAQAIIANRK